MKQQVHAGSPDLGIHSGVGSAGQGAPYTTGTTGKIGCIGTTGYTGYTGDGLTGAPADSVVCAWVWGAKLGPAAAAPMEGSRGLVLEAVWKEAVRKVGGDEASSGAGGEEASWKALALGTKPSGALALIQVAVKPWERIRSGDQADPPRRLPPWVDGDAGCCTGCCEGRCAGCCGCCSSCCTNSCCPAVGCIGASLGGGARPFA